MEGFSYEELCRQQEEQNKTNYYLYIKVCNNCCFTVGLFEKEKNAIKDLKRDYNNKIKNYNNDIKSNENNKDYTYCKIIYKDNRIEHYRIIEIPLNS